MTSPKLHAGLSVAFQTEVLAGGIVTSCKRSKNLVLDVGLDMFAAYVSLHELLAYVVLGTGTKPTRRDSGTITASQTGNTVTASGAFFEAADVGRLLKFDSGAEVYITAFSSATEVTVADSVSRSASEVTVWYVNATGHEAEHSRLSSYSNQTTAFLDGVYTVTRTFTSSAFASGVLLKEIGWAPKNTGALFGRALIPGGGDFVGAGKQYRVTVSLSCKYGPAAAAAQADVGNNGFSTAGAYAIEYIPVDGLTANHPFLGAISADSSALTPLASVEGPSIGPGTVGVTAKTYIAGSFSRSFELFAGTDFVLSGIRSIQLGSANGPRRCARLLLSAPQIKDGLHTLTLTFGMSWGRILIN
jgi:hypothetical protein